MKYIYLKKDGKYLYDSYRLSAEIKIIKILLANVALLRHNTYIDSGTRQLLNNHEVDTMNNSIADQLIEAGAKVWEKGNMKRIYINDAVAKVVFNENLLKDFSQVKINVGKAKFYFDIEKNVFTADSGSIRTAINSTTFDHGFRCTK